MTFKWLWSVNWLLSNDYDLVNPLILGHHFSSVKGNRKWALRGSKVSIDYKQLHEDRVFEEKRRCVDKYLPRSNGPSETWLEAQKHIVKNKKSPESSTNPCKVVTVSQYVPLRNVSVSGSDNMQHKTIKQEWITHYQTRPIKPEPGIYLRHRENPKDRERVWKYVHVSRRCCNQGGDQDCNSQSENEAETNNDVLPDLPTVSNPTLPAANANSGNTLKNAHRHTLMTTTTSTPSNIKRMVDLISPPAIERRDYIPCTPKTNTPQNLGNLLCTLNFDAQPNEISQNTPARDEHDWKVVTSPTEVSLSSNEPDVTPHLGQPNQHNEETPTNAWKVVTSIHIDNCISSTDTEPKTPLGTRSVVTITSSDSSPAPDHTKQTTTSVGKAKTNDIATDILLSDEDSNQTRASANLDLTPWSVITNPDATELETANVLLQLGNFSDTGNLHDQQDQLEATYDNSDLLPVNAAPLEDFARDMREKETDNNADEPDLNINKGKDDDKDQDTDSDKTVDYNMNDSPAEKVVSPKENLVYKQYGIVRQSPKTAPNRSCQCPYCETTCHSKCEWNIHHKTEHAKVKCPECNRLFPTPDALTHHRYMHNESHWFKCTLCDKICSFKSDLEQHMSKHTEAKLWYCSYDGCTRDFKQKSDLTAHEVVHTREDFLCKFLNCVYKNKDPRLVKRHQCVHTKEAKVEYPVCGEKFIFYMQMKWHCQRLHTD